MTGSGGDADESDREAVGVPEAIADQPPATKLVYCLLVLVECTEDRPATQHDLRDRGELPERTVRSALSRLEAADLVTEGWAHDNPRQKIYSLTEGP